MKILAGDLGGTKTLLCLAEMEGGHYEILYEQRFATAEWPDFPAMLRAFRQQAGARYAGTVAACCAVAGPVKAGADGDSAHITNVPWQVDSQQLKAVLEVPAASLINDFQGVAYGISLLRPEELAVLQTATPQAGGARAVIGAGTGLGEAILAWDGNGYRALPTEGGHVGFAPEDAEQCALHHYWSRRLERVSWEHLLSGSGLARIFEFVCASHHEVPGAALQSALQAAPDSAAAISEFGLSGRDAMAGAALDLFVRLYGSQAGNLALSCIPSGGLYVAGGIAPKILPRLQAGGFIRAFLAKAPMRPLLESIPVAVVLNQRVGLLGAMARAAQGDKA